MTSETGGGSAALIHLSCFGGFKVTAETPLGGILLRPTGVAMLAILAAAGDDGVPMEQLRALVWSTLPDAEAWPLLEQSVAALRRGGNGDALVTGDHVIALNPDLVRSDVARFRAAMALGDASAAGAIYEGPFLGGVALEVGAEFEEWLERTRALLFEEYQTLMRRARRAARSKAAAAETTAAEAAAAVEPDADRVDELPLQSVPEGQEEVEAAPRRLPRWLLALVPLLLVAVALMRRGGTRDIAEGDAAMARLDWSAAHTAYGRALARDSSDASLWLRVARARDAVGAAAAADSAALRADSLASMHGAPASPLTHAYRLWRQGNVLRAIAILDSLVHATPDDAEAQGMLGAIVMQSGPMIGRAIDAARIPLERSTRVLPGDGLAWERLLRLSLAAGDSAAAGTAWRGYRAAIGAPAERALGWLQGVWSNDTTPLAHEMADVPNRTASELLDRADWLGLAAGNTTAALQFTEPLRSVSVPLFSRQQAHILRAELFGAVGDWSNVDSEAAALAADWPWGGLMLQVAAALSPSRTSSAVELQRLRDAVMRLRGVDSVAPTLALPRESRTLRLYLFGELSARLGDATALQASVDSLSSPKLGELDLPRHGDSYALTLQALQLVARGDTASALQKLELGPTEIPVTAQGQLWVNSSLERRRRALWLATLGRPGEAAGWLASVGDLPSDLLLGPRLR